MVEWICRAYNLGMICILYSKSCSSSNFILLVAIRWKVWLSYFYGVDMSSWALRIPHVSYQSLSEANVPVMIVRVYLS